MVVLASGLDTEGQRSYVQQEDILHVSGKHSTLDGCTNGHYLIGIDTLVGSLSEELLHDLLDSRDTCRTSDEQYLIYVGYLQAGIGDSLAARLDGPLDQVIAYLLELSPGKGLDQVFGHTVHRHDVRQVDLSGGLA